MNKEDRSNDTRHLLNALMKAKAGFSLVTKDGRGSLPSDRFARHSTIHAATDRALAAVGLMIVSTAGDLELPIVPLFHTGNGDAHVTTNAEPPLPGVGDLVGVLPVRTELHHMETGEWMSVTIPVPCQGTFGVLGAMTMGRKAGRIALLDLPVFEEDEEPQSPPVPSSPPVPPFPILTGLDPAIARRVAVDWIRTHRHSLDTPPVKINIGEISSGTGEDIQFVERFAVECGLIPPWMAPPEVQGWIIKAINGVFRSDGGGES